jgi:ABC-type transporter Mla MlaB component
MKVVELRNGRRLSLEGELTVSNAADLRQGLLAALEQSDRLELDLDAVTAIDLAGLQLLCSAQRTAMAGEKSLTFKDALPPALQEACANAGFDFYRSCRCNQGADCFCAGGREK